MGIKSTNVNKGLNTRNDGRILSYYETNFGGKAPLDASFNQGVASVKYIGTLNPYPSCDATGSWVDTIGSALDQYIPGSWTRGTYSDIFVNNKTGILVNQDGSSYCVILPLTTTIQITWIRYEGGSGGVVVSLNTSKNWTGTTVNASSTSGGGGASTPRVDTYNVISNTKYYIRTGLSGEGNPVLIGYVSGCDPACIN